MILRIDDLEEHPLDVRVPVAVVVGRGSGHELLDVLLIVYRGGRLGGEHDVQHYSVKFTAKCPFFLDERKVCNNV